MSKKMSIIPLIMIVLLIAFPSVCLEGASNGISMWAQNAVPSLFPFMAVSTMLILSGVLKKFASVCTPFAAKIGLPTSVCETFVVGLFSGYPVGASMAFELYRQNTISSENVCFIAVVSSFCSPVFMLSTIGVKLLNSSTAGLIIMAAHYLSFILMLILCKISIRNKQNSNTLLNSDSEIKQISFGALLKRSLENAVKTILTVGGYIVMFSIIIHLIDNSGILPDNVYVKSIVACILEMSNGSAAVAMADMPIALKIALICFCTTWGGICVLCQISGFISECGVSSKFLIVFKFVQGIISASLGFLITRLVVGDNSAACCCHVSADMRFYFCIGNFGNAHNCMLCCTRHCIYA